MNRYTGRPPTTQRPFRKGDIVQCPSISATGRVLQDEDPRSQVVVVEFPGGSKKVHARALRHRLFRKDDKVRCQGVDAGGVVMIDEKPGDKFVFVQFDGRDKLAGVSSCDLTVTAKGVQLRAPRATAEGESAPVRRSGCSICGEDHGEDGHPSDYDDGDDPEGAARRALARASIRALRGVR